MMGLLDGMFGAEREGLRVRLDLVLISILAGNDYFPKLRGSSIPHMWARYVLMVRARVCVLVCECE